MKKIICLILALLMLVSVVACNTAPADNEETTDSAAVSNTDTPTTKAEEKAPYTGPFKAGYSRVDITPEGNITLNTGDLMTNVMDPLYVTCIAVNDGKNTALIITSDVKNMGADFCKNAKNRIRQATKVGIDMIMMSATHNHSAPTPNAASSDPAVTKWTAKLYSLYVDAAKEAIADLADAEIYAGTAKAADLAFVRRYFHEDGSFSSIHYRGASTTPKVRCETEADPDLQMIRFVRKDKKDILMCNWQCHVASAIGMHKTSITADLVYFVRRLVEQKNDDVLVAYYQGASGNINTTVAIAGTGTKGGNYQKVGIELANIINKSLDTDIFKKLEAGKINGAAKAYMADIRDIDPELLEKAEAVVASGAVEGSAEYNALLDKYGLKSKYEVNKAISINKSKGKQAEFTLGAISFGDVGFVSVPYEMFDTNGMEVKDGSPFDMTFVLTCAGGGSGYVPSALSVPNGGYEVYTTGYRYGTAEEVVAVLLEMLNKQAK